MKVFFASLVLWGVCGVACAQDFREDYRKAKELFAAGKYSDAMSAFMPLTVYDRKNPYPEYASFYYGVSAYRLGFLTVARDQFFMIRKLYPRWEQMPEVNFWLMRIFFEQGEYFQALRAGQEVSRPLLPDAQRVKRAFLSRVQDVEVLRLLVEENPYDAEAAHAFLQALAVQPFQQERRMMDSLISRFGFAPEDYASRESLVSHQRTVYRIGLIMPFMVPTLDPTPVKKRNQLVLDLYQGVRLAADSLTRAGKPIEIYLFDNERSAEVTSRVLAREELKAMDVIVGPVFPEGMRQVGEFCEAHGIPWIPNPVSGNSELVRRTESGFLFQPSFETQARAAARYAATHSRKKTCIIYSTSGSRDSTLARNFKSYADSLGLRVVYQQLLNRENSGSILSLLTTATEFDKWKNPTAFKLKKDSIGVIFAATDDPLHYTKVINAVEARADSILVIGLEGWMDDPSLDYRKFENIRVVMLAPNFASFTGTPLALFRKEYVIQYGVLPNGMAQLGFETGWILGEALHRHGNYFLPSLRVQRVPGFLYQGFRLQPQADNEVVPFVRFRGGLPVLVPFEF